MDEIVTIIGIAISLLKNLLEIITLLGKWLKSKRTHDAFHVGKVDDTYHPPQ